MKSKGRKCRAENNNSIKTKKKQHDKNVDFIRKRKK